MTNERLKKIFKKTDGNCHICHGKLVYSNYSYAGSIGAWEIEHSRAKFNGGSNHMNNLYAAHISCNRQKGLMHSRTARSYHGNTRAPYSKAKKQSIRNDNVLLGATVGFIAGSYYGPIGRLIGAGIGAVIGDECSPRK